LTTPRGTGRTSISTRRATPGPHRQAVSLIGPRSFVAERLAALRGAGVTTIKVQLLDRTHDEQLKAVEQLRHLVGPPER
jgi:L-alanine-DL-glutamate epimerase-like enolase superfamily enzyme